MHIVVRVRELPCWNFNTHAIAIHNLITLLAAETAAFCKRKTNLLFNSTKKKTNRRPLIFGRFFHRFRTRNSNFKSTGWFRYENRIFQPEIDESKNLPYQSRLHVLFFFVDNHVHMYLNSHQIKQLFCTLLQSKSQANVHKMNATRNIFHVFGYVSHFIWIVLFFSLLMMISQFTRTILINSFNCSFRCAQILWTNDPHQS